MRKNLRHFKGICVRDILRSSVLSFWLVQNLSSLTESGKHLGTTSGNDGHWNRVRYAGLEIILRR